jgi:hypothetical protein
MILFLENNRYRANKSEIEFEHYKDVLETIFSDTKCNNKLDNFLQNSSLFDDYDTIIIHENIYTEEQRKKLFKTLENHCKNKQLVKFSGNNSQASLSNISLQISAEFLYKNLKVFLEEYKQKTSNILMLAYGKNWSTNKLLNTLQEINLFIESYEDEEIDFDEFEDDYDLLELKKILSKKEYNLLFKNLDNFEEEIDLEQIKVLALNFKALIQAKSNG